MSGGASGHGGARPGAGRRKGDGFKWGEPTRVMRIPASRIEAVSDFLMHAPAVLRPADAPTTVPLPLFSHTIRAGFPSPADDYVQDSIDLNAHLIRHKAATFLLRVRGDSMVGAGIHDGDIIAVDVGGNYRIDTDLEETALPPWWQQIALQWRDKRYPGIGRILWRAGMVNSAATVARQRPSAMRMKAASPTAWASSATSIWAGPSSSRPSRSATWACG